MRKIIGLLTFISIAALSLAAWTVYGQTQKPMKVIWEYKVVDVGSKSAYAVDAYEAKLNELSAQGWELVTEYQYPDRDVTRYTLRRAR